MTDEQIIKREIEKADEEWWNSHGRATSTFNSQGTGKDWQPVKPEKVYCLFHRKLDCICIKPVVDEQTLKLRIESAKRLEELNERFRRKGWIK